MYLSSRFEQQQIFLQLFDDLMAFRDAVQGYTVVHLLSALFFVTSFCVATALLVYWSYSAVYLLGSPVDTPSLEPLRWDRRLREFVLHLIFPTRWIVQ